jgi:V/A-type H+-transporting ATPase subunit E
LTGDVSDLIEKINQDGIRAAEEKARIIEAEATKSADEIVARAQREAEEMIAAATERIRIEDEKGKMLLAQAGRDLLLSIRKEINAMLGRILVSEIGQCLTPEALFTLVSEVVRNFHQEESDGIEVFLNDDDMKLLENHVINRLREEMKKPIMIKPSEEISKGFIISFDGGKSCYDYTDTALAEYIGNHLKPKLNRILQDTINKTK